MEIERISVIFEGELPERVQLDCVSYRVRPFEAAPLKEYGHTAEQSQDVGVVGMQTVQGGCVERSKVNPCVYTVREIMPGLQTVQEE